MTFGGPRKPRLGESLTELIRQQGFTGRQKELSDAVGISEAALSHYISGRSQPAMDKLVALAANLDVTLDELVFGPSASVEKPSSLDEVFINRQVQMALDSSARRAARQMELTSHVTAVLSGSLPRIIRESVDRAIDDHKLEGMAGSGRLLLDEDAALLEETALAVRVLAGQPGDDGTRVPNATSIVDAAGRVIAGPFLEIQARKLRTGIEYKEIFQGPRQFWTSRAATRRSDLRGAGVSVEQLDKYLELRGSEAPAVASMALLS
jgi:transcriptional regulator with XRE-family HTH domain